jgi:hypothetical protein
LDDHEPVIASLELYVESHEDEYDKPNLQVGLLISSINDDKIQREEQQINHVELNQQETLSLHILVVVQEWFDEIVATRDSNFGSTRDLPLRIATRGATFGSTRR